MLTTYLTTWSKFFETPTSPQLVKKLQHFMKHGGSLSHSLEHATCPYSQPDQPSPYPYPTPCRSFFYVPPIYASVLQVISPSEFPTKILYAPLRHATCPANLVLLDFITRIICVEYRSYSSLLCSLLHFCCLILLRPKLSSSAPYAQTPQSIFFFQFQRPIFIPIQNRRQNYSSVYFSLSILWQQTGRQKILHRMIQYIPRVQPALNFFTNEILIC
jgi:hypothetical protein